MKKRFYAAVMAAVMVVSLAACTKTPAGNETPTPEPTQTVAQEASIDFEDGQYGFAMMSTRPRKADASALTIAQYNGNKALYVESAGGAEMHVGFDLDALLGDKITQVRKISLTVGTEHSDGKFAATAGTLKVYTGEDLAETQLEGWSIYMEKKNPKVVTFTLPDDVAFTAGNDNYMVFNKVEDLGAVLSNLYIDDICFYDANGALIKGADTSVVMEAPKNFLARVEEPEEDAGVKVALDESYKGDWTMTTLITPDVLSQFAGKDITVTYKFELVSGLDYYLWAPMDAAWTKLGAAKVGLTEKAAAEEGDDYFIQPDGSIVIVNKEKNQFVLNIKAADMDAIIAAGGLAGQTYGVTTFEANITAGAASVKEKVALDDAYKGDWGQTSTIPADVLSKFAGMDVTVTYKFELVSGLDYYLWAPMDAAWAKLGSAKTGLAEKTAAEEGDNYHMQADGFIVIDNKENTEITFTLKAADVDALIAAGGLSGQTYGVTTYEAVLEGKPVETVKEKVALDDAYKGDWGQTSTIPADVLSKFAGMDVTVTVKYELQSGLDYYLWAPMDAAWAKLGSAKTGLAEKTAAEEGDNYHMQADGFIVIDNKENTEITFTVTAAVVDELIAAGGLSGQTYGVTTYEAVLEGKPAAAAATTPAEPEEEVVEITGSVAYTGTYGVTDTAGWTQVLIPKDVFLGTVDPANVTGVKISGPINFVIGYNSDANGTWAQFDGKNAYEIAGDKIALGDAYYFTIATQANDGKEYTFTWEVYTK